MNLFDILRQAGGGDAFSALGSRFGLSEDQVAKAVEAFMPAFSAGLKRRTADPLGVAELMQRLALGGYGQAHQSPAWAFGAGRTEGDAALAFLFGSPAAAQALAAQASAFTGLARDKLGALLPALAAMTFGGLARQAAATNPVLDAMMKQLSATAETRRAARGPLDRYEDEQAERERRAADLARVHGDMMKAGMAVFETGANMWQDAIGGLATPAASGEAPGPEAKAPGQGLFGDLFEPGRCLGETYQRDMEAVLDRFRPATNRS